MTARDMSRKNLPCAEQQIELLKAELLTTVSHELRGPLTSIKGYTATLLRYHQRLSREECNEFLMAISGASTRLEHIIDQLLEMSLLETNTIPVTVVPVNLAYLVREALTAAQQTVTSPLHLEQENETPIDNGVIVQGDRRLLRNMLDALLENAAHYSPHEGQVQVGIRPHSNQQTLIDLLPPYLQHFSSPLPLVEIWVKDHGIGIPTEHLPHIFDRFYRIDTGLTREVNGLGLGLSICKCIVELHGGIIWGESSVDKGSTFHILLPQAPDTASLQTIIDK